MKLFNYKRENRKRNNLLQKDFVEGLSIVETVIYIGLVSLCLLLIFGFVMAMSSSYRSLSLSRILANSASFSMERITREVRLAYGIDFAQSALSVTPGRLRLQSTDTSGAAQSVTFALEDGRINVYKNDLLLGALTSSRASTTRLVFTPFASETSAGVLIEMSVQASKGDEVKSAEFRSFIQMRNSH